MVDHNGRVRFILVGGDQRERERGREGNLSVIPHQICYRSWLWSKNTLNGLNLSLENLIVNLINISPGLWSRHIVNENEITEPRERVNLAESGPTLAYYKWELYGLGNDNISRYNYLLRVRCRLVTVPRSTAPVISALSNPRPRGNVSSFILARAFITPPLRASLGLGWSRLRGRVLLPGFIPRGIYAFNLAAKYARAFRGADRELMRVARGRKKIRSRRAKSPPPPPRIFPALAGIAPR